MGDHHLMNRLERLWHRRTHYRGDKADRKPVMEASGPANSLLRLGPPKISAAQMSTFYKATRHKKHREECPLHFILPASLFYIKAQNWQQLAKAALNKESTPLAPPKETMQACIYFRQNC